jgi:hypothetical protein
VLSNSDKVRIINNVFEINGNTEYGGVGRAYHDEVLPLTERYYRGNTVNPE